MAARRRTWRPATLDEAKDAAGLYAFVLAGGKVLYVGKAGTLDSGRTGQAIREGRPTVQGLTPPGDAPPRTRTAGDRSTPYVSTPLWS